MAGPVFWSLDPSHDAPGYRLNVSSDGVNWVTVAEHPVPEGSSVRIQARRTDERVLEWMEMRDAAGCVEFVRHRIRL